MLVCFLTVVIKRENPYLASYLGFEVKPLKVYSLGLPLDVDLPAVLTKVHHRPEPLYVPARLILYKLTGWFASLDWFKPYTNASSVTEQRLEIPHAWSFKTN